VPTVQGDGSRIQSELQWAPSIPVEDTLLDTLTWWREHAAAEDC
jgi:nucleoside-diphosphate-sugar epimerase